MLCEYGCKQDSFFVLKNGKHCCNKHISSCPAIRQKNSDKLKAAYKEGRKELVFNDELRRKSQISNVTNLKSKPFEQWSRRFKDELILSEQEEKCDICKGDKIWNNEPLVFELDHIDGNNKNNKRENLRLLCPNCHSQTSTWRGRNNGSKIKISDEELIEALKATNNIRQALLKVGLVAKGFNYKRAKKLFEMAA